MTDESKPDKNSSNLPPAVAELVPNIDEGLGYLLKAPAHIRRMTSPVFRLRHFVQFRVERLILRGAIARLLVIALAIGIVAIFGGISAYYLTGAFDNPVASTWWAFLRITDPGYLADDEGTWLRIISVLMTIGGLVLVIGALIAIMTQWLDQTIGELEQGLSPIVMKNHVLILGWGDRTPAIIEQILSSEARVNYFLDAIGGKRIKIVILAEQIGPVLVQELKDRLGPYWRPNQIILRSGSALRLEHLERVDYRHAAAVVLPAENVGSYGGGDESVVKALMTAGTTPAGPLPLIVAEIISPDHISAANKAYPGRSEILASGLMTGRVVVQTARYPGLARVIEDLFDQEGTQIFLHDTAALEGVSGAELMRSFGGAIPLGLVRGTPPQFVPLLSDNLEVQPGDLVAVIAHSYKTIAPRPPAAEHDASNVEVRGTAQARVKKRVLVAGWNETVPSLLAECGGYAEAFSEIVAASIVPIEERETAMARRGVSSGAVRCEYITCDITARADLERLDPASFDVIIVVASDWVGGAEAADARSLLGYMMLNEALERAPQRPHLIIEAMSEASEALFTAPGVEVLVTPKLQSHMLAQVTLRPDLNAVFEHLFGLGGAEVRLRAPDLLPEVDSFAALQAVLFERGEIALGARRADGRVELNPPAAEALQFGAGDQAVILTLDA